MATMDRGIPRPSVSFLSEVVRSNSNDVLHHNRECDYAQLNRRLLRIQIFLVVLGLTLLVVSSVALIEERTLFGLGFGVCGAFAAILSAMFVVTSCDVKILAAVNGLSLAINTITVYFVAASFYNYLRVRVDGNNLTNYTMVFILCFVEFAHSVPIMAALTSNLLLIRQLHLFKSTYETT